MDEAVELEALVLTHGFDSGEGVEPYSASVRLTGRRVGVQGTARPQDTFDQVDRIERLTPGSGPVSVSSWVYGLQPGEWTVSAELQRPDGETIRGRRASAMQIQPAAWSWRHWTLSETSIESVKTRWARLAPLARVPGVIPGSWPALGFLAVVVALITQTALLPREGVVGPSPAVSILAIAFGLVGAKSWYAILHPGSWREALLGGWAVDGFLFVAVPVAVIALLAINLPIGGFLDASAPGMFFAVAIGRVGCFLTGCCAGRCTDSRWGVWSSDRHVGARRVPAQLIESGAGLLIGVGSILAVLSGAARLSGLTFVAAFGAYLIVRQLLLRLRAERREYSWQRARAASR
jgi:phosphatidylglycerol:prolipoprotein diacylglycerol transferase